MTCVFCLKPIKPVPFHANAKPNMVVMEPAWAEEQGFLRADTDGKQYAHRACLDEILGLRRKEMKGA